MLDSGIMSTPNESTISVAAAPEATTGRTRRVYTAQEKAEYLALFEQGGMAPVDFCREMGINEATFSQWRRSARQEPSPEVQFAEVQMSAAKAAETTTVTLRLPDGTKQHTSVEAGDFLRILETHSPIQRVEMTEIRRQQVKEYRWALG